VLFSRSQSTSTKSSAIVKQQLISIILAIMPADFITPTGWSSIHPSNGSDTINSHPRRYAIEGKTSQIVAMKMDRGDSVALEAGNFFFASHGVEAREDACAVCGPCIGLPYLRIRYTSLSTDPSFLGATPKYPAQVFPLHLSEGKTTIVKKGAILAQLGPSYVNPSYDCASLVGCCTPLGLIRRQISSSFRKKVSDDTFLAVVNEMASEKKVNEEVKDDTSVVFVSAGGIMLTKVLGENESVVVAADSIVAFEKGIKVSTKINGSCCCGGAGCLFLRLTGPGTVVICSMPFRKFKRAAGSRMCC
jgi:uncharacterized protein (AIM24 family)